MIPAAFDYVRPASAEETIAVLAERGDRLLRRRRPLVVEGRRDHGALPAASTARTMLW